MKVTYCGTAAGDVDANGKDKICLTHHLSKIHSKVVVCVTSDVVCTVFAKYLNSVKIHRFPNPGNRT